MRDYKSIEDYKSYMWNRYLIYIQEEFEGFKGFIKKPTYYSVYLPRVEKGVVTSSHINDCNCILKSIRGTVNLESRLNKYIKENKIMFQEIEDAVVNLKRKV